MSADRLRIVAAIAIGLTAGCGSTTTAGPARATDPAITTTAPIAPPPTIRLPRPFAITRAALDLAIDPAQPTMTGHVRLAGVMIRSASVIWLHAMGLDITRAVAVVTGSDTVAPPPIPLEVVDLADGRVALRAPAPLTARTAYDVELDYTAPVADVRTVGTFREEVDDRWYVFTQHEPIAARRSFPCLDEPDVKIPWTVTLTVPAGLTAVANAPAVSTTTTTDGHQRVAFAPTEPLPSYLVAYAVGPFELVAAGTTGGGAPIRVIVPAGASADVGFAVASIPPVVAALERWFGTPYPFAKLDLVAVPETYGFVAMENAGLVTVNQRALLLPTDAPVERRRAVVWIVAHELAHMWFGDLVTPRWWDDLWLNESFADWMASKVVAALEHGPVDDALERGAALDHDREAAAGLLRRPAASEADLEREGGVVYGKGAAVLRMMEAWIGADEFQRGVRAYLADHARGTATTEDLLEALTAHSDAPGLARAFTTFLDQASAPVLAARIACTPGAAPAILVTQRHDLAGADVRWRVPVCVVAGAARGPRARACGVVDGDELRLELARCPTWVWPNADGLGYFRTELSAAGWGALATDGWALLSPAEQQAAAQDLGDAPHRATTGLHLVPALFATGSRLAIHVALATLAGAAPWVAEAQRDRFRTRVDGLVGARARALGWLAKPGDSDDDRDVRAGAVGLLARLGDPILQREAVALAADVGALPPASRRAILQAAVRADPATFDRLRAEVAAGRWTESSSDLAAALAATHDPARLQAALALLLDPGHAVADIVVVLTAAVDERARPDVVEQFVVEHLDALRDRLHGSTNRALIDRWHAGLLAGLTASCAAARVAPTRALAEAKLTGPGRVHAQIAAAFARMDRCVADRAAIATMIDAWSSGQP